MQPKQIRNAALLSALMALSGINANAQGSPASKESSATTQSKSNGEEKVLTRADVLAHASKEFDKIDKNNDGVVTHAEAREHRKEQLERVQAAHAQLREKHERMKRKSDEQENRRSAMEYEDDDHYEEGPRGRRGYAEEHSGKARNYRHHKEEFSEGSYKHAERERSLKIQEAREQKKTLRGEGQ